MFTYDEWLVSIVDVVERSNLVHCKETEAIRCKIGGWSSIQNRINSTRLTMMSITIAQSDYMLMEVYIYHQLMCFCINDSNINFNAHSRV